jgi:hypothetical protein
VEIDLEVRAADLACVLAEHRLVAGHRLLCALVAEKSRIDETFHSNETFHRHETLHGMLSACQEVPSGSD